MTTHISITQLYYITLHLDGHFFLKQKIYDLTNISI